MTQYAYSLNDISRSRQTALLIYRLDYWFSKMGNRFYKFIEPASNQRFYREGDSWTEELCISRKSFARAFDKIGTRHKSKSSFKEAKDKFQGKPYASYYDRQTKQTVFLKNTEIAASNFKCFKKSVESKNPIFENKPHLNKTSNPKEKISQSTQNLMISEKIEKPIETQLSDTQKTLNPSVQNHIKIKTKYHSKKTSFKIKKPANTNGSEAYSEKNIPFYNGQNGRSGYIYKYIYLTKTTSSKQVSNLNQTGEIDQTDKSELVKIIKNIWIEKIGDDEKTDQTSPKSILKAFMEFFNGSIEKWKEYCTKIASSDFLMGKIKNTFKIWISWALKKETYNRINSGDLGVIKTDQIKVNLEKNEFLDSILLTHSEKNIQYSLIELSKIINPTHFKAWFNGAIVQKIERNTAFLRVKNKLASYYVRNNFSSELAFCFNKFNPEITTVEVIS